MINYNLNLDKVINKIRDINAKSVLIQLPDGLKPQAKLIQQEIQNKTNAEVLIYLGSCYGSCDIPNNIKTDLIIQWGHSEWV